MKAPVETKVLAGTAGAGAGAVVASFILWLIGCAWFDASWSAGDATAAVAAVPEPVAGMVTLLITTFGAFIAGWLAPHTMRTDDVGRLVAITTGHQPEEP